MKNWGMIVVVIGFVAAAGALAYGGIHMIALHHSGTPVVATIVDCEAVTAGRQLSCKGTWTVDEPGGRQRRVVRGTVEDATVDDIGTKMNIVVSGNRGWKNATALRLGIIALVFAALCLSLAIMLPLGQRAPRRPAGRRPSPPKS